MIRTNEIEIVRRYAAPPELVFRAWTDKELLVRWYSPHGCSFSAKAFDPSPGGQLHWCIHHPVHGACWVVGNFEIVDSPSRLAYTMAFSNEAGDVLEPVDVGRQPEWPKVTRVEVTFAEEAGGTVMTLRQTVDRDLAESTGALPGWIQMFDRLEEVLR